MSQLKLMRRTWVIAGTVLSCAPEPRASNENFDESFVIERQIESINLESSLAAPWWNGLWQPIRNGLILLKAQEDLADPAKYVGLNCKEWVRKVVREASQGLINIPPTCPDASGWYWCESAYVEAVGSIDQAAPGDIVQMRLPATPHTAIVINQNKEYICWIESNWQLDLKVRTRCEKIQHFLESLRDGNSYTVYRIVGK